MENNSEMNTKVESLKIFFRSRAFWKPFIAFVIGGLAGFLYYYFIGCNSGTCAMTSNPYSSILFGGFLGFFAVNSPCTRGRC